MPANEWDHYDTNRKDPGGWGAIALICGLGALAIGTLMFLGII